jgi:murein DD-endopeptidase MepM/ murein hydrolase activator NlpD
VRILPRRATVAVLAVSLVGAVLASPAAASPSYDDPVDLTFPVDGHVTYTDDYDSSRSRGAHGATDLGHPDAYGLPVHAAVGGTVSFITGEDGNPPSYGYMIRIAGDDGRDYAYIHLGRQDGPPSEAYASGIRNGSRVERGQHIGYVGHSGNASASWPHLHFEIHDDEVTDPYGDHRRNPYASLREAEARDDYPGSVQAGADPDPEPGPFDDVDGDHPHVEGISAVVDAEVTIGCDRRSTKYCPTRTVNRGQMATFLMRAMELPVPEEHHFDDVPEDHPHADGINAVAQAGIVEGDPQGAYRPEDLIQRDHMASWLAAALDLDTEQEPDFDDVDPDSEHAGAIAAIAAEGVAKGNGNGLYRPDQEVNRAQMATFLMRAFL